MTKSITEKLLSADVEKFKKLKTETIESPRLTRLLGSSEPEKIKIGEIPFKKFNEISNYTYDENGKINYSTLTDSSLEYAVEGIIEPNLKDEKLMNYFGVSTPDDLAVLMFGNELNSIVTKIIELSNPDAEEAKVKN